MRNTLLRSAFAAVCVAGTASAFAADVRLPDASAFYGGISLREGGAQARGITIGHLTSEWSRFTPPVADDTGTRALFFGGYRWNDVALEASLGTTERYTLRRTDALGRSGVGLALPGFASDPSARQWNVDVYGSWSFWRAFSLYGRLGYVQADAAPAYLGIAASTVDPRRSRDGVNYGIGVRYDMTPSLGLKLEYARFARFPGEAIGASPLPDGDQVQLGVQYRF